jgi:hypothetical protein
MGLAERIVEHDPEAELASHYFSDFSCTKHLRM